MWIVPVILLYFHNVDSLLFCSLFLFCLDNNIQLQHYAANKWYVET